MNEDISEFLEWRKGNANAFYDYLMRLGKAKYNDKYADLRTRIDEERAEEYKNIKKILKPRAYFGYGKDAMSYEDFEKFKSFEIGQRIAKNLFGKVKFEEENREKLKKILLERIVIEKK